MDAFDFFIGVFLGVLFYHVFIIKLLNSKKFQRIKSLINDSNERLKQFEKKY